MTDIRRHDDDVGYLVASKQNEAGKSDPVACFDCLVVNIDRFTY